MLGRSAFGAVAAPLVCASAAMGQIADSGIRTIEAGETTSIALKAFSRTQELIVHGSERDIVLDEDFRSIGPLLGGPDVVEARWSEIRGFGQNVVQVDLRTRDGGAFVPPDLLVGGDEAEFIGWEVGASNPIEFLPFAGEIEVIEYKIFVSEDQGLTFSVFDLTSSFLNPWDGVDIGRTLPLRTPLGTPEYNFMIIEYTYEYTIPAPGTIAVLAGLGLAARRRR
ncbi:MAG: hypothetical protein AAFX79_11830 [Planctomycetota bacterium]